jgi:hypothetical protein
LEASPRQGCEAAIVVSALRAGRGAKGGVIVESAVIAVIGDPFRLVEGLGGFGEAVAG